VISVQDVRGQRSSGSLVVFRQDLWGCLTRRGDALFELADALASAPARVESLPGLSLEPEFRRGHGSVYAALTAGRIDEARLRRVLLGTVGAGRDGLVWFAGDVSNWARPEAACSPQRVMVHDKSARTLTGAPVTSGWPFAVMAALEWGPTSWTTPVDLTRLGPADTLTGVTLTAIDRVRTGLAEAGRAETPGFVFDAEYDLMALSHHHAGRVHVVGRLRSNQIFHAEPPPPAPGTRGRRRRHGDKIALNKPDTLTTPDRVATADSPRYGQVTLTAWDTRHRRLIRDGHWRDHDGPLPIVTGTVLRVEIERLPGGGKPAGPMWLWHAGPTQLDLVTVFAAYQRRFDLEHTFRFLKHDLGWTTPAPMLPDTAVRWSWLTLAAYTQLRLARGCVRDLRLPWEKPQPAEVMSPRRVRRDFRRVRGLTGTPANPPKFTRPGPGRPTGSTRPPRTRHPTHHKNSRRGKKPTPTPPTS
jgi:DDE superfamily endonuclease